MSERIKIVVDAMGGDNAPLSNIEGTMDALKESNEIEVILVGDENQIKPLLEKYDYDKERVSVLHASEVIDPNEHPAFAIKKKADSSLVVGQKLLRTGAADAFVSAGSTGAILVGGQVVVGRLKGIERPALAPLIPTYKGVSLLIDGGGNVDAKPSNLVQFAKMGSIYMENVMGVKNPKVAIVNIGAEEEKGNQLVKETFPLLKACEDINFVGNIEPRDIPSGDVDVIVCEAFTGNVILKMYEGVSGTLMKVIKETMMSSLKTKIGAVLIKDALKERMKAFDVSEHGGAPMLGLKHLVVKAHGSSKAKEIRIAILQCIEFNKQQIPDKIAASIAQSKKEEA